MDTERYAQEKLESERLDLKYGFRIAETEAKLRLEPEVRPASQPAPQTWAHLSAQIFQTPYAELARMVEDADPAGKSKVWADLGSAYGRLGIVLSEARPDARFIGIEIAEARVLEARRVFSNLGIPSEGLLHGDLTSLSLPAAEIYLIYDFGNRVEIEQTLARLRARAATSPFRVVGRGRAIRDAIERNHPWLGEVCPPLHRPHYSVYSTSELIPAI